MKTINLKTVMEVSQDIYHLNSSWMYWSREAEQRPDVDWIKTKLKQIEIDLIECRRIVHAELVMIDKVIRSVEGKATKRTATAFHIIRWLNRINDTLNVSKKAMNGIRATLAPGAERLSKAYAHIASCTYIYAEYKNGSWRIIDIRREMMPHNGGVRCQLKLTDECKAAIIEKISVIK